MGLGLVLPLIIHARNLSLMAKLSEGIFMEICILFIIFFNYDGRGASRMSILFQNA